MKKKILFVILIISIAAVGTTIGLFFLLSDNEQEPPPYEPVLFDEFPVPLYNVFMNHSPSEQAFIINMIENGRTQSAPFFLTPYPNILDLDHFPLPGKWYINTRGVLDIKIPLDSYLEVYPFWSSAAIVNINGTDRRADLGISLYLSYYVTLNLGHVYLNESIMQQFIAALGNPDVDVYGHKKKAVFLPANTTIGVSYGMSFDFMMCDTYYPAFPNYPPNRYDSFKNQVNPFNYFTEKAKNEILSYHQMQYNAKKKSGGYIRSRLNYTGNINENKTIFGMWFAQDWPYYLNQTADDYMGKYWYDGCVLNIINVNQTDSETFYKDTETGQPLSSNMIGVYGDSDYQNVDNYTLIGGRYMYLIEGNLSNGIVNLTKFFTNERLGLVYMKYELIPSSTSIYDDLLHIEYFDNLTDAQGPFTDERITYIRSTQESSLPVEENGIPGYDPILLIGLVGVISVVLFKKSDRNIRYYKIS